ncbi:MAG: cation:proton antiporter [Eubacterium sp.]|nr:cation:proton antiporter [Eubacterium sp.]
MLLSIALLFVFGMGLGVLCKKVHIPPLFGMIIAGVVLGPSVLNWMAPELLTISSALRKIALVIILLRAGLSLDVTDLKKVGRPALLMCFVPACFEMAGTIVLAPILLGVTRVEAAVLAAALAAVSPAVIVPKMLKLMEEGYGTRQSIPQMILAGASVDDVFVIVMFATFTEMAKGGSVSLAKIAGVPLSIVLGVLVGILAGWLLGEAFRRIHVRDTMKVVILLCLSFFLVTLEDEISIVPFSGLLAIMTVGITMKKKREPVASRLSIKFNKIWVVAEVVLFVLVGATVDIRYVKQAGLPVVGLILTVLVIRMIGVWVSLVGTKLKGKERLFCMFAYCPKATVQAAIGGVPLAMGLSCGNIVLTVAVLSILITAPLGAFLIDLTHGKCLEKDGTDMI